MIFLCNDPTAIDIAKDPKGNVVLNFILNPHLEGSNDMYSFPMDPETAKKVAEEINRKASDIVVAGPEAMEEVKQHIHMPGEE